MTETLSQRHFEKLAKIINRGTGRAVQGFQEIIGESQPYWLEKNGIDVNTLQLNAGNYGVVEQEFTGLLNGKVLVLFTAENVQCILQKMLGDEMDAQGLNDIESEAMGELGNIMVNAGLSAIADSLHVLLESTVTCYKQYSNDKIVTLIQQENNVENILVTHVNLMISGNALLGGKLIMLLNNEFNQEIAEKIELSAT
jgi:chemotaxis protein CheC